MYRLNVLLTSILFVLSALLPGAVAAQSVPACADEITVVAGDTLTELAERYFGDAMDYPRIIAATNARARVDSSYDAIDDAATIKIGWRLCIPPRTTAVAANPVAGGQATREEVQAGASARAGADDVVEFDGARMTIDFLRSQRYPGSNIVVEEALTPGKNYYRYLVSYRSEGLKIYGLLTIPQGRRPATGWPVIVFNHGYIPPEVYRPTERYVAYVDAFARNGYIVFRPDYRGHGFSEGEARGAYGAPDYTIDVLNALASIKRHPDADPARIGMWGHSMGGYITLRSMVTDGDIKAGVVWAGVVASYPDLIEGWTRDRNDLPESALRWRTDLLAHYGDADENPAFWAAISANSYLEDLSGPVQIYHGTADTTVPAEFSVKLFDQIKAAGAAAEIYTYLGDDHNLAQNLDLALARSLAFFDRHVKASDG